ncbi:MAG: ribulose bisphosphate carboxylase small subunit [Anaerolineae bacterium]|nr:ribulose bisphosphate carboxylase small subunit [Anaerolineales bacterium]MCQ3977852.1 ribulose bisphosphate carboxylase small subunit [Anaerolineae bacterium]
MRITQGTFSYLPDLTDEEIKAQVQYCLDNGWPVLIEYSDDPHPRNVYWEMWGLPLFDLKDAVAVMEEIQACRRAFPNHYIRVNGYDRSLGRQTTALSFIVNRPPDEPGFLLERTEGADRQIRYTLKSYAAERPAGKRYEA